MFTFPVRNLLAKFISLFKHFFGGKSDLGKGLSLSLFKLVLISKES